MLFKRDNAFYNYLEQSRQELLRRNGKRDITLSNKTLQGMQTKWALP
ncbi:hypothetical protein [Pectobacterium fontis]|nr:hypothetical protein [Pectobacterium fontis]